MRIKNLESAESMPTRESMRKSAKGFDDDWYCDDYVPCYSYWKYIYRFIEKHIGHDYNDTYSEFLRKIKKFHLCKYMENEIKDVFVEMFRRNYPYFIVDDDNKIGYCSVRYRHKSKEDKAIHLYSDLQTFYKMKSYSELTNEFGYAVIKNIEHYIGKGRMSYMMESYVDETFFQKYWHKIYEAGKKAFGDSKPVKCKKRHYNCFDIKPEDFFDISYYGNEYVLEYRSSEYVKYLAEKEDASRKRNREDKKKRNEYLESLLYYVEYKRKEKEKAENDVKIIKHGFDPETSFRNVS